MKQPGTSGTASTARRLGGFLAQLWPIVRRKLDQIDTVTKLDDLKVPPGNRLHALGADRRGFHAVRVNDQYRIVFRFEGGDAFDVQCTDYH
jgi:proteic killer suppression protein